ncbi:unnamed protein product [Paramecium pentaurelia]|uniref:Protein kinase domain-containing protein n=1 Tax=Paramecium pentaurelia TaxID=43138 RepID=A0A8S1SKW6_9CILI|nr:unnamed protein product [Paramecium pentaurelia]
MNQTNHLIRIKETLQNHPHHNIGEFQVEAEGSGNYKVISNEYDANTLEVYLQGRINYWLTIDEILNIIIQILDACIHLEQLNITHRNLNLRSIFIKKIHENIIIVKIVDFSQAVNDSFKLSQIVNKPPYQAPEIVEQNNYDNKCDIYSLGIILYQLCFKELNNEQLIQLNLGYQSNKFRYKDRTLNMLMERMIVRNPIQRIGWNELKNLAYLQPQILILQNRYLIDKKQSIGKGYQGEVYKTYDLQNFEHLYCTKINNQIGSFYNEIQIIDLLQNQIQDKKCKNIINFIEIFTQNNFQYIIMEYCQINLDQYFKERNFLMTEEEILNLLSSVINGYIYLKDLGIIHRDIKPSNILLKESDDNIVWKLIDFGCGKVLNQDLTQTRIGTELFKAPEIFDNYPYDYQCDIFSLGVLLHYLVFEGQNYCGFQKDEVSLREFQLKLKYKPFQCQKPFKNFSNNLLQLIDKMLMYKAEQRIDWYSLSQEVNLIQNQIRNQSNKTLQQNNLISQIDSNEQTESKNQEIGIRNYDSEAEILFEKGQNLYWQRNFQEAIICLDQSFNLKKNNTHIHFFKADSLRMQGFYNEAIAHLESVLLTDSKDVNSLWCKADCLKMINKFEDSIFWADKVLSIDPNHINSLFCKGDCLKRLCLFDDALMYVNKALLINSEHLNSMWCKAEILKLSHKYEEAIFWVNKALSYDNSNVNSLQCKAEIIYRLGRFREAIIWAEQALSVDSHHVNSLWCKAECLRMLNQYQEAIFWSDKALSIDQNHLSSLRCKAESLKMLSRYEEAIVWIDKALSINPNYINSLFCKADSLRMLNQYREAIQFSDIILSINPNHINALFCKADSLRMLNQYTDAIIWVDKILQIDSQHIISLFCKGESLRMLKYQDEAIFHFNQILQIDSNHIQSLASIGTYLQDQMNLQGALEFYNKIILIDPKNQWAQKKLKQFKQSLQNQ